jgi:glyoxylase-like metal-dependent hydrolase (beta-lactamase superfamily II)
MNRRTALTGALAAPALLTAAPALAQQAAPASTQAPGFYRFRVGEVVVTTVYDGFVRRNDIRTQLGINATPDEIQAVLDANGLPAVGIQNPYIVTFLQTPRGVVALDAGTGAGQLGPGTGLMPQNMAAAGIRPEDVTLVCISHFHGDHITGLTTAENQPFFPNAEIAVPAREWAWFSDEANAARSPQQQRGTFPNTQRRFGPLRARMRIFEGEAEVAPGIRAIATPGHTPGHTAYHIASGNEQMFYTADASSRPDIFLRQLGWWSMFDFDGQMAIETRRRLFDRIAAERALMTAYHFTFPGAGRVVRDGNAFRFVPVEWSSAI